MRIGKYNEKGKYHLVNDIYNNKARCSRIIFKENVIEISREDFRELYEKDKFCNQCYKRYLGV